MSSYDDTTDDTSDEVDPDTPTVQSTSTKKPDQEGEPEQGEEEVLVDSGGRPVGKGYPDGEYPETGTFGYGDKSMVEIDPDET